MSTLDEDCYSLVLREAKKALVSYGAKRVVIHGGKIGLELIPGSDDVRLQASNTKALAEAEFLDECRNIDLSYVKSAPGLKLMMKVVANVHESILAYDKVEPLLIKAANARVRDCRKY